MNTSNFTPRKYQKIALDHILKNDRCALFASMGMGKTVTCLTAVDTLQMIDPAPVLVLAPKRVATSTWPHESKKWQHLQHLTVLPIVGTAKQRADILKQQADVFTINYEQIPWLVDHLGDNWPFKMIIADESTRLKSYRSRGGSKRARALAKVAHKSKRFVELTGTPSPNGLIDLWGQMWFIDGGERLGRTFTAFQSRWFKTIQVGAQRFAVRIEPHDFAQKEIQERLADVCLTLDANDYFDISKPIINDIRVTMPAKGQKIYDQFEKELFFELADGEEVEAVNMASKTIKCLQLASGAIYKDDGGFDVVHDAKIQALESIVEEASGAPILVAYHFKSDLDRILKHFKGARHLDDDPRTIDDWNAGKIQMLLAHPASAGHGLNLQDGGNILVVFSHWWNLEEYQQIVERIGPTRQAQAGHDRPVFIYHLITKGTVDELILQRREGKKTVQDILLNSLKRKHNNESNLDR